MNDSIEGYHPKISYLIEKLKAFSIKSYNKYKIEKICFNKELKYGSNIANDIIKFVKKYKKNYKQLPSFKNLLQLNEQEEKTKNDLIILVVENLFNIDFQEKDDNVFNASQNKELKDYISGENDDNEDYRSSSEKDEIDKENISESEENILFKEFNQENDIVDDIFISLKMMLSQILNLKMNNHI